MDDLYNDKYFLKKASEPFKFFARAQLIKITGLKAGNLQDFVKILRTAPDTMVYFHTHHFPEEHYYLTPEPFNDFAVWVTESLGYDVLGETLASLVTFEFPNLASLRDKLAGIIDDYISQLTASRAVLPSQEFHFMKSVLVIMPTQIQATDLREFLEGIRQVSLSSIYFHIFESKLRLGKSRNDFTMWLKTSLGENDLGEEIARLDPYTYTLEGLRLRIIQMIEKRIK
jgi:hypothetical protein